MIQDPCRFGVVVSSLDLQHRSLRFMNKKNLLECKSSVRHRATISFKKSNTITKTKAVSTNPMNNKKKKGKRNQ